MNSNRRHAQKTTPYREKVLTLQKPVPTLKKKIRISMPHKFYEKSPNFIRFGWITKKL